MSILSLERIIKGAKLANNRLIFDIKYGLDGFREVERKWQDLFEKLDSPVYGQSPGWFDAYLVNLCGEPDSCIFITASQNEELVAILPLIKQVKKYFAFKFKLLCFPESSHFGLKDILLAPQVEATAILPQIYHHLSHSDLKWDLINLESILTNSTNCKALCELSCFYTIKQSGIPCNTIKLTNLTVYMEVLSKNFKRNIVKGKNKLSKFERVEYLSYRARDEIEDGFSKFLDIEASGWKGATGTGSAIGLDANLVSFYRQVLLFFSANNQIEINLMLIDGKPAAVQYAILLDPTVFLLKIGYDELYAKCQPGHILLEYALEKYSVENYTDVNLVSNAKWHTSWMPTRIESKHFYIARRTIKGASFIIMHRTKNIIKNLMVKYSSA